ncbi:MAG: sugar transferase [Actinomycetota bacterium]
MVNATRELPASTVIDARPVTAPVFLVPATSAYSRWLKRPLDVVLALVVITVFSPVLVAIAIAIPLMLGPGGVLYRQERLGRNGQPFMIYKFRSMLRDRRVAHSPNYIGPERRMTHKSSHDPRHRPFGRFLRATSLDELPQLINILRGEMSLVGPRPEITSVAQREGFAHHPRHLVRPGLTGRFQISPLRSANRIAAGLHLDIDYVVDVTFWSDLKILVRTVMIPFMRRGS